jgi:hypothetical protein
MFWIFAAAVVIILTILAVAVFGFALHLLFSPWVLLVAVGVIAWIKFRPRSPRP